MKKNKIKEYYIISGLYLNDNNRGTAALSYGSFAFLSKYHNTDLLKACNLVVYKKPWKFKFRKGKNENICLGNEKITIQYFYIWFANYWIYLHIPLLSKVTRINRILKKVSFVAAINGGDGFSDIYNTKTFKRRLLDTNLAIKSGIPLILLPQTLGPFKAKANMNMATKILKYASKVYIRDLKFASELERMSIPYVLTKDLSYYMNPEKINIDIQKHAIGLNVSGLCYSNRFRDLTGCFNYYPQLVMRIIGYFQSKNVPVYLLSHSYNYKNPEREGDDMQAAKEVYFNLSDKENVYLINKDLTSPQTKYIISQFEYFIGTRMHANFAAIYTNTPVFGLAYSYKYEGAFDYMGLKGHYASILNIEENNIGDIISQIDKKYHEIVK